MQELLVSHLGAEKAKQPQQSSSQAVLLLEIYCEPSMEL